VYAWVAIAAAVGLCVAIVLHLAAPPRETAGINCTPSEPATLTLVAAPSSTLRVWGTYDVDGDADPEEGEVRVTDEARSGGRVVAASAVDRLFDGAKRAPEALREPAYHRVEGGRGDAHALRLVAHEAREERELLEHHVAVDGAQAEAPRGEFDGHLRGHGEGPAGERHVEVASDRSRMASTWHSPMGSTVSSTAGSTRQRTARRATTANLFVEQSACTRTAPTVHGRRGEPASRVRCGRAGPLDYLSPSIICARTASASSTATPWRTVRTSIAVIAP
jgi:hypothetical protein